MSPLGRQAGQENPALSAPYRGGWSLVSELKKTENSAAKISGLQGKVIESLASLIRVGSLWTPPEYTLV